MYEPYWANGLSRFQIGSDGAYSSLDFEGTSGWYEVQDDFTFTDDVLTGFYALSHWCADGLYIGQATNDLGSVTAFGHFRRARSGEDWRRFEGDEGPLSDTVFQAMDVSLFEGEYSSGKDQAWHEDNRERISSGTLIRRR
jgi:hypothetical protein